MEKNNKNNEVIDLTEILKNYSGKWVILSNDNKKVLKSGNTLEEIEDYSTKGIIMLVPNFDYAYSPSLF